MADRKPYSSEVSNEGFFSDVTVERARSDRDLALDHAIGRNRRVGQFLCYLSLMRAHGCMPNRVSCTGALFQDFSADRGQEAAHYLPGQIFIVVSGRKVLPWDLVSDAATKVSIASLFSRVQSLAANFNKADSYVEKYAKPALKDIFARACQKVVDAPPTPGAIGIAAVRDAYGDWIAESLRAYRYAINRKVDIAEIDDLPPATAPGFVEPDRWEPHLLNLDLPDLFERAVRKNAAGKASATVWDYSEQIRILGYYIQASQGSTLGDRLIQDVVLSFKA